MEKPDPEEQERQTGEIAANLKYIEENTPDDLSELQEQTGTIAGKSQNHSRR
jgi:hypothetical protein